jgi:uncharacterized membrane protein YeaQ/YmgE (transglycosylase-associated protein family)
MDIGVLGNSITHDLGSGYTGTGVLGLAGHTIGNYGLGGSVLTVLTAVIGVAIAYFLFKFAWRKIKGSVH